MSVLEERSKITLITDGSYVKIELDVFAGRFLWKREEERREEDEKEKGDEEGFGNLSQETGFKRRIPSSLMLS